MKIICISGKGQHGKDSTAQYLSEYLEDQGEKVLITHFADLLKYICKSFFDWNGEKDAVGRTLLQHVGTNTIRKMRPNYWVDFLAEILEMFPKEWDYVLIPDCRFPNEVEVLRNKGLDVDLIRVDRVNFVSPLSEEQQRHSSETAMDFYPADYYILNDGRLEDLEEYARKLGKAIARTEL